MTRTLNKSHKAFVASLPCVACLHDGVLNHQVEVAHLRSPSAMHEKPLTGMQIKPDDKWVLPLCPHHHRDQHSMNELKFWRGYGIDPFSLATLLHDLSGNNAMAEGAISLAVGRARRRVL